ncbi:MAG TPA: type 4a pilus biogenesis protein PilO [Chthonomonadaceae bacterium]|nr:type 4a pilus biogenesis protein PilO [Chthonomonadaceae bacterium]
MPRTKRERTLLLIAIIVVPIILIVNYLMPSGHAAAGARALLPLSQANFKRDIETRTMARWREEEQQMQPQIARMSYDLPADQVVPQMVGDLQRIATRAGVHLGEIKPVKPDLLPSGAGAQVPVSVRFRAPLQPNTIRFLYEIEDPGGKFVVEKMDITSGDARFQTVEASAQISVFTRSTVGVAGTKGEHQHESQTSQNKS